MELKINNDYSYLITNNYELRKKIWEKLRFLKKNYMQTRAFKNGTWSGHIDFFNKDNGKFLTGLLLEIRILLNYFGQTFQEIDERNEIEFETKEIDKDFLKPWAPKGKEDQDLYDYQVDLVNQAIKHKRGIIQAPPGSGKSLAMIAIIKALPSKTPILFLVNRKSLITQNYEEMKKWGIEHVGRFYGDYHEEDIITCATVQSAHHLDLSKFKVVIADEIHMLNNKTSIKTFRKLKSARIRIAVSATPYKFGGKDQVQKYLVKGYFGPIFKTKYAETGVLKVADLQERGNLSHSECTFYHIDEPQIQYDIFMDAIANGIAQNMYFHNVVTRLTKKLKGRTLILVERVAHGDHLHNLIKNSLWIYGKDDEDTRKYVIDKLQESKTKIVAIATKQIFDTGLNFFIHNLVDCTIITHEHGTIQGIGRGLRVASDKEQLNYYGFVHRTNPYLEKHSKEKVKILKKEKHNVIVKDVDF